jgi:transketolase
MRLLPNMVVLECGDATDVESVLDIAQNIDGPVYVRMLRGEVPRLFKDSDGMIFNQARVLQTGDDVTVLSSGVCTSEAMLAVSLLQERGVSITHLHVSTLKPFDDPTVLGAIATARKGVVTMENHSIIGGLGAAVAEAIAEGGLGQKLIRIGLQDVYAHGASFRYLMREYGLDALGLIRAIEGLLDESFAIEEQEVQGIDLTPRETHSKPEEL